MSGPSAAIQAASSVHRCCTGGLNSVLTVINRRTGVPAKSASGRPATAEEPGAGHGARRGRRTARSRAVNQEPGTRQVSQSERRTDRSPTPLAGTQRTPDAEHLVLLTSSCNVGSRERPQRACWPTSPLRLRACYCNVGGRERPLLGRSRLPGPLVTRSSRRPKSADRMTGSLQCRCAARRVAGLRGTRNTGRLCCHALASPARRRIRTVPPVARRIADACPRPLPEALNRCSAVQRDDLLGLAGPVHEGRQILPGVPGQPPVFDHAGR